MQGPGIRHRGLACSPPSTVNTHKSPGNNTRSDMALCAQGNVSRDVESSYTQQPITWDGFGAPQKTSDHTSFAINATPAR